MEMLLQIEYLHFAETHILSRIHESVLLKTQIEWPWHECHNASIGYLNEGSWNSNRKSFVKN